MFSTLTAITALNVQVLPEDLVRMGQGLLGVVRNIGASLGVTVASVLFERRRVWHQLSAYDSYNEASASHLDTVGEIKSYLHDAGISGGAADQATLRIIRQQMNVEAIASGFRDNFLMISIAFFLGSFPLWWLATRRSRPSVPPLIGRHFFCVNKSALDIFRQSCRANWTYSILNDL